VSQRARAARGAFALACFASACVTVTPPAFLQPAPARDWDGTLSIAQADAASGMFGPADSVLAAFDGHYSGSGQAIETRYWRALFDLDPANTTASTTTALSLLDAYLADGRARAHVDEAKSLRRVANAIDSLHRLTATVVNQAQENSGAPAGANARQTESKGEVAGAAKAVETDADEIKRLKDELAKANDELDRIKKRLATQGKPPR